jgi:hypothetical protein
MNNVVLLGDSIFDNKAYVDGAPDVVTELRGDLPGGWTATLAARDGSTTADIAGQLKTLPFDATHLVVSAGGNDALQEKALLEESARSVADVLDKLAKVCTIYEAHYSDPTTRKIAAVGLTVFNDVITRAAFLRGLPVIDLRLVMGADKDYANDVEPSVDGGAKIAKIIATAVTTHDFTRRRSVVYV